MTLEELFRGASEALRARGVPFAVAGGFAMDLYRREPRLTMDVDLVILTGKEGVEVATSVLESLGLRAGVAREADLAGGPLFAIRRKSSKPCMVVGRPPDDPEGEGVDILLPEMPWIEPALHRAQANEVDFGFGAGPALTLEDAILSKLYALNRLRAKDLDDLQSIFAADQEPDVPYLAGQMRRFGIVVPKQAEPFLPDWLLKLSRDIARSKRQARQKGAG
jgi:hypothetical protein